MRTSPAANLSTGRSLTNHSQGAPAKSPPSSPYDHRNHILGSIARSASNSARSTQPQRTFATRRVGMLGSRGLPQHWCTSSTTRLGRAFAGFIGARRGSRGDRGRYAKSWQCLRSMTNSVSASIRACSRNAQSVRVRSLRQLACYLVLNTGREWTVGNRRDLQSFARTLGL